MKQIQVLEANGFLDGAVKRHEGDIFTCDDVVADMYIGAGWAKCTKTGDIGKRTTKSVKLDVNKVVSTISGYAAK